MVKYGQVEFLWGLTGSVSCFTSTSEKQKRRIAIHRFRTMMLESYILPNICDPLQENQPLADFREISVLGINRLEIYRRVQRSSFRAQNRFIRRVTALKLYTGSPSLRIQFYEKRSILCARGVPYTVRVIMNSSIKTAN